MGSFVLLIRLSSIPDGKLGSPKVLSHEHRLDLKRYFTSSNASTEEPL